MHIPKTVKVGAFDYDVIVHPDTFASGDSAVDGLHTVIDQKIQLANVGNQDYQNTVFLHELLHAIIYSYLGDEEQDEWRVEQLSKGLYQVIKDNPDIFKL